MMRKAFTLVEMLIVVAILAVLMSIAFRLGSLGDEDSRRTATVVKMQKIENCLSGYYAAFGSYPPVAIHGSRDIYCPVDGNGDQSISSGGSVDQKSDGEALVWARVEAACRSQPFGCEYPGSQEDNEVIESWAQEVSERVNNSSEYPNYASGKFTYADVFSGGTITGPNPSQGWGKYWDEPDWKVIKLFKFGMMSYLLPRYMFMMAGDGQFFGTGGRNVCAQWDDNNDMPCDPFEGVSFEESQGGGSGWEKIRAFAQSDKDADQVNGTDLARVANIPTQAVCARWIPNLEQTCCLIRQITLFGVKIGNENGYEVGLSLDDDYPPNPGTHSPPSGGTAYKNAFITIHDGWGNEFYYYSPAPYQAYTVWSAGSNGKTFPPWMSLKDLDTRERETAFEWKKDDLVQMNH